MDSYLKQLEESISAATAGVTAEQLTWHPQGKWSTAEILEHLLLTYTGTVRGFQRCLQADKPLATAPTWKHRLRTFVLLKLEYFPQGREAPAPTRPKGTPPEVVLSSLRENIRAMDEIIAACAQKFGERVKLVDHPILGPLTAREWRKFHWIHARHHMRQIERLRATASGVAA
jgi:uncharacterized protein DUF1569